MRPHPRRTSAGGCARPRHPPHKPGKGIRNVQPTAVRRPQPLSTGDSKKTSGRGRGEGRKRAGELVTEGRARHERCPRGRQWHPRLEETVVVATAVDGDGPWCGVRRNDPRARMACRGRPCLHRLQRVACTHASTIKTIRIQVHEHETCVSVHHTFESQHKNVMKILFEYIIFMLHGQKDVILPLSLVGSRANRHLHRITPGLARLPGTTLCVARPPPPLSLPPHPRRVGSARGHPVAAPVSL